MSTNDSVQQQYDQLTTALNASMDGVALLDASGIYYYLNPVHLQIFGYEKAEELIGKTWQFIYEEEEIQRLNDEIFPVLIEKKQWRGETIGKSKTGSPVFQEISLTMMEDGGIICICRDIKDRIEEKKKLILRNEIMEKTNSMIIITNPHQEIEWVNKSFCDLTGYSLDECIGKKPGRLLQGKDSNPATIAAIREKIRQQQPFNAELLNYKKDGTPYWIEIKGQPLFNSRGKLEHFFAIEEDITARIENQQKIEESNIRLELALRGISAATWELNLETGEMLYSDFLYEITGYSQSEISNLFGENRFFMYEDDKDHSFTDFAKFLKSNEKTFQSEYRIKHKKGHDIWLMARAIVSERNSKLEPIKVIGILIDISKIKEAQQKIEESERKYKKTMEASGAALWEWDLINNEIYVTQEFRNLLGLPSEKDFHSTYETLMPYVHPEDTSLLDKAFKTHFDGESAKLDIDYRFKKMNTGAYEWYNMQGAVIEWTDQQLPAKAIGYVTSIQDRKLMEIQLKESEERWYNAMVVSGAGFWDYDIQKDSFYFSAQMKEILGYTQADPNSENLKYWEQRVHPEDISVLKEKIHKINRSTSNTIVAEFRLLNNNNQYIWISASGMYKLSEVDKTSRYSGAAYNITNKKIAEIEMEKARKMAESSVKAKRRFLANVSHEIRTPMHAIMGLSEQLASSDLKPEQSVLIQMIAESSKSLMNIINDVLDLSKIEEGKLIIDEVVFDPYRVIQQVFELFTPEASKKQILFTLNKNTSENLAYIADPGRIRQILSNIISNAIKFTEKGKVEITLEVNRKDTNNAIFYFVCTDTGIGMSEEMKKRVFEEFVQEDESFHRKYGGSGLGLSITYELVKLMHGSIAIQSQKNKGTTVTVDIPLKTIRPKNEMKPVQEEPINTRKLQSLKLLVAEDNEFNCLLLKFILDKNKISYDFAENGKIAVEKALTGTYDLILMDIQMPEMDGIEATQILRKKLGNEIPIIAVTANAVKEELDYYLKNGLSDYLTKPFEEKKLLMKMQQLCR